MMIELNIDEIEVGLPIFNWLLGKMSDDEFWDKHGDLYSQLVKDGHSTKEEYLEHLEKFYEKYLFIPILVEKYTDQTGNIRYKMRDGRRRLSVLNKKGCTRIKCVLWQPGWTKKHWEYGRLLDIQKEKGIIDEIIISKEEVHGEFTSDAHFLEKGEKKYLSSFLVHTGVAIPYILDRSDSHKARGDDWKKTKPPKQYEFLAGIGKHHVLAENLGSHPLNMYLVGHLPCGPEIFKDPSYARFGRYVLIQQYFRGGCWGHDVPGYPYNGYATVKEQIMQNNRAIPLLFKLGILKEDTQIYFSDQSADKPCSFDDYFKLFKGEDCLERYYEWLANYFRKWRSDHFNVPIEEVIDCIDIQI